MSFSGEIQTDRPSTAVQDTSSSQAISSWVLESGKAILSGDSQNLFLHNAKNKLAAIIKTRDIENNIHFLSLFYDPEKHNALFFDTSLDGKELTFGRFVRGQFESLFEGGSFDPRLMRSMRFSQIGKDDGDGKASWNLTFGMNSCFGIIPFFGIYRDEAFVETDPLGFVLSDAEHQEGNEVTKAEEPQKIFNSIFDEIMAYLAVDNWEPVTSEGFVSASTQQSYVKEGIVELNAQSMAEKVLNPNAGKVLVFFYSDDCDFCRRVAPAIREFAVKAQGFLHVYLVDVNKQKELSDEYCGERIPAITVFDNGDIIDFKTGVTEIGDLFREELNQIKAKRQKKLNPSKDEIPTP